jgi:hypothetical protein
VRRFASEAHDLDVDFTAPAPAVAAELLRRCASLTADAAWDLAVGERIAWLLRLAMLSKPGPLTVVRRCASPSCGRAIEIEITEQDLREWTAGAAAQAEVDVAGRATRIRRPTGRDQRDWMTQAWTDRDTARRAIARALVNTDPDRDLDAGALSAIESALARIDPLVDFTLTIVCPWCAAHASDAIDLEREALTTLRAAHERLLLTVARLATKFHWTESAIFALPAWRRERYLALADAS